MKILQVVSGSEFQILEVPVPEPAAGEVRVRVDAVTICAQWDLHLRHNEPMFVGHKFELPYVPGQPGHEASGIVDAIGEGVESVQVGDRISVWCDSGHTKFGAYAQYMVRPADHVIRVPEHLPAEATASVELAMCISVAIMRMRSMGIIEASRLAVLGLGPAGLIAVQMLRAEGANHITALDLDPARRELAVKMGADEAHDPRELSEDVRFDSAIDCVGAKRTVEFLLDRVKDTVQLFGVQREDYAFQPKHFFGGVRLSGYPSHNRTAAEYAVGLIEQEKLDLAPLVTHRFTLEQYGEAMEILEAQKAVKVCLFPFGVP